MPGPSSTAERAVEVDTSVEQQDMSPGQTPQRQALDVVSRMLVDVIGPEYLLGLSIDLDTSFDADLELESLEFVALAERLLEHYGEDVDFVAWLATMDLDEIIALTVGDLVSFIVSATSAAR